MYKRMQKKCKQGNYNVILAGHSIFYKIVCASALADQSFRCLLEDSSDPLLSTECPAKTDQTAQI